MASGSLGLYLAYKGYFELLPKHFKEVDMGKNTLANSLTLLVLSLSVLFILWFFRTYDTREQIKKTQEQVNLAIFSKGLDLIGSQEGKDKANGFILLVNLRISQGVFKREIDRVTQNIVLEDVDLRNVNLTEVNLTGAKLKKVNLKGAILREAILIGTVFGESHLPTFISSDGKVVHPTTMILEDADFWKADISGAKFEGCGKEIDKVKNLETCTMSVQTKFYRLSRAQVILDSKLKNKK